MLVTVLNNCLYHGQKTSYQPVTIRTINRQKDIKKKVRKRNAPSYALLFRTHVDKGMNLAFLISAS